MKNARQSLVALAVLGLGVGGFMLLHLSRPAPEATVDAPRPLTVFVERVRGEQVALNVQTQGEVRPRTEMELVAEVSGRVLEVAPEFIRGGRIEPGALLLRIDDADYRYALVRAQASVAEATMRVEQIKADAAVARRQLTPATATPLGLREPQLADARAKLRAAQANLARARLDLSRTRVSLPFRGRMRETLVDVGQFVSVGTPIGRAFSTDVAEVMLPLTDQQLASLDLPIGYSSVDGGGPAVEFSALVAGVERHWSGRITRLDAEFDSSTRLVHALAEVAQPYDAAAAAAGGMPFAIGLFVDAEIEGRQVRQARVIPRTALRSGNAVYVVADGRLKISTVDVLHQNAEQVVLAGGVEAGDVVVVSPLRAPVEGMHVEGVVREALVQELSEATQGADPA